MREVPFFSILLPTKGRSHLVGYAIQSVLDQSFGDFEVVVMDNDECEATRNAVSAFDDPRILYRRSGGLNMSENWERALDEAKGRFITILEDKQAYYPFALQEMRQALNVSKCKVVVWEWDIYDDRHAKAVAPQRSGRPEIVASDKILKIYVTDPSGAGKLMPRMLNSCIDRSIAMTIKGKPRVSRFFAEYSPDLCAAFHTLSIVERVYVVNRAFGLVGYASLSNAVRGRLNESDSRTYYGVTTVKSPKLEYVPIKSFRLTYNTVYDDFLRVRETAGGRLSRFVMKPASYARVCLWDVIRMYNSGANRKMVIAELVTVIRYLVREAGRAKAYFIVSTFLLYVVRMTITKVWEGKRSVAWDGSNIYVAAKSSHRPNYPGI